MLYLFKLKKNLSVEKKTYNTAFNYFTLEPTTPAQDEVELVFFNSNGKIVSQQKVSLTEGVKTMNFESTQYARGMYFMKVVTKDRIINPKVILN